MTKSASRILSLALILLLVVSVFPFAVAAEYPLWDGSAKTVKMKAGEELFFTYVPAADGPYTISQSTSVIRTSFEQAGEIDKNAEPIPVYVEGKNNPNDECYRLKGGVRYIVRMSMWEGHTEWPNGLTDTISIYAGEPKKEVDLLESISLGSHKLTVKPGDEFKYKFTPAESGTYVLYSENTVVDVRIRKGPDDFGSSEYQLFVANPFGKMFGYKVPMTAGETYIISFGMWEGTAEFKNGFTDTYHFEKTVPLQSASLHAADDKDATTLYGYVGGEIHLFAKADPLYYSDAVTDWSISDLAIASVATDDSGYIQLKKPGTVTVTATIEGKAVTATVTVKDRPRLEQDKTTTLTFGGSVGVECTFTPDKSGTYYFRMTGPGGTTEIRETGAATYWEGSGSLSAYLTAGKTYTLVGAFGPADYTVKVSGKGSGATNAAPPSGDEPADTTTSGSAAPSDTVSTQSDASEDGSTALPTEGEKPAHKVPVHYENGKGNVRYEDVAHLFGEGETLTVAVEDAAAVILPTQTLTEAAQANTTLRVELPHATVSLEAAVLARVAQQAQGDTVELTAENIPKTSLTAQQQKQLKNKEVAGVVRVLLDGGTEIHDLGGMAAVTLPFTPAEGKSLADYTVYYLSEDGKLEKMKTVPDEQGLTFLTTHFSDYTVVYEPNEDASASVSPLLVALCVLGALLVLGGGIVAVILLTKTRKKA